MLLLRSIFISKFGFTCAAEKKWITIYMQNISFTTSDSYAMLWYGKVLFDI